MRRSESTFVFVDDVFTILHCDEDAFNEWVASHNPEHHVFGIDITTQPGTPAFHALMAGHVCAASVKMIEGWRDQDSLIEPATLRTILFLVEGLTRSAYRALGVPSDLLASAREGD